MVYIVIMSDYSYYWSASNYTSSTSFVEAPVQGYTLFRVGIPPYSNVAMTPGILAHLVLDPERGESKFHGQRGVFR